MSFRQASLELDPDLGWTTADATWLGKGVTERQAEEARAAGLEVDGSGDVVTVLDGVANRAALAALASLGAQHREDLVGILPAAHRAVWDLPGLGPSPRLAWLSGGGEATPDRLAAARHVELRCRERVVEVPVGDVPGGRTATLPLSEAVLCPTGTWVGLLWANLAGLPAGLWGACMGPWWRWPDRAARTVLRARSSRLSRVVAAARVVADGARVHRQAVVEATAVGPGAVIGPGAVVRGSILGEGAVVEPGALVVGCVLGPGARVQRHGWIQFSVLCAGASHGGAAQLSMLAAGARVKGGAYLLDQRLDEEVRVRVDGVRQAVPLGFAGVGVGAGAFVGTGACVQAGRTLAPGSRWLGAGATRALETGD